jgi:hypothetical protein
VEYNIMVLDSKPTEAFLQDAAHGRVLMILQTAPKNNKATD